MSANLIAVQLTLTTQQPDETNYVIYMVNPFKEEAALPHLCAIFLRMFNGYVAGLKKRGISSKGDLVLQIIPMDFLIHTADLVLPSPKAYQQLAFEVYNRCGPQAGDKSIVISPYITAPVIRLTKPIPKSINLRLNNQSSDKDLLSDHCLHLAYEWHWDQQWLTVSWTDNLGVMQWNAAYCLADPQPDYWDAVFATVKEIWDTTLDMLQPNDLAWRVFVVKSSPMHRQELEGKHSLYLLDG